MDQPPCFPSPTRLFDFRCFAICTQHLRGDGDDDDDDTGWVPLKVICNFPKVKKLSKDIRAVALALEGSEVLVVSKATRVRRKVGGGGGCGVVCVVSCFTRILLSCGVAYP